jgi:hypothetical protein
MNKKGQGIDWFVVSIIIAVMTLVVFVVVAIFFPFSETIDRSACQTSIVLRAAVPSEVGGVSINAKDAISVRCKTTNICVTAKSGKGNCTQLGKEFTTMKLTGTTEEAKKEQIKMFLSREMADCWGMFGEGKLQIFAREFKAKTFTSKGIICDKIEFDNSVLNGKDDVPGTSDDIKDIEGLMFYMVSHKVPNNNYSYMDYLRGTIEGDSAQELFGSLVTQEASSAVKKDIISLEGVKSIVYIESTLTNFADRIGGATGAVAGMVGAFYTRGFGARVLIGGGALLGSNAADSLFKSWFTDPAFCNDPSKDSSCSNHVGGLMLTNYTVEGFSKWKIDSFENL